MRTSLHPLLALALVFVGGFVESGTTPSNASSGVVHLYTSQTSLAPYPVRTAIGDSLTFRRMWREIVGTNPAPPHVDFTKYLVVIAAMGSVGSTGHMITVVSIDSGATPGLRVRTRLVAPGNGCVAGGAFTNPVDIVRIPDTSPYVIFSDTLIANDC